MPAQSKCKRFGLNFRSQMLNFGHRSLLYDIHSLKYFQINGGSRNAGNKDERCGEMDMGGSRGCIATSYLPLSDIAKLYRPNDVLQNN
jgi:hypothetical protein